jgi:glycosyltransferase involved in cell wall biosynthesis
MPVISVVIPVYNGEQTIKETIESVLSQTFTDFELIISNDGSQDDTLKVVSNIPDSRIKVFSYSNAGLSTSRNRGIFQATGEYIAFIDADDLWTPDKLAEQLKVLQNNPQAAVAYSWTDSIDESGQFFRVGGHRTVNGNVLTRLILNDFIESGSNPLIRKQALIEVGGFDESLTHSEDWDMWLRLAARYHFIAVPSVQILYRVRINSWSYNVARMEADSLRVIQRAYAEAPESIQHLKRVSMGNRYKYLTFKALDGYPVWYKGFIALRFFWNAVKNDPVLARHKRMISKVLLRSAIVSLLPPQLAQKLLAKTTTHSDIFDLFKYIQLEP